MEEIWKDIPGYEGMYQVSNLGRVKSVDRFDNQNRYLKGKVMKQRLDKHGYFKVNLSNNGKKKLWFVHRLVAIAFIPNPYDFPVINHKDENPQNNNVDNLEWCTFKYNANYGTGIQRRIKKIKGKRTNDKKCKMVYQYSNEGELMKIFFSLGDASRELNIRTSTIRGILHGRRIQRKDFVLSFIPINSRDIHLYTRKKREQPKQMRQVYCYTNDKHLICIYQSTKEASQYLGVSDSYISIICNGKCKQRSAYILSYVPLI